MMDVDSLPKAGGFAASRSTIPTIDGSYRALLASRLMGTPTAHAGIIGAGPWASMIRHAFYEHDITHIGPDRLDADTGFRLVLNDTNGGKTFIATYGAEAQGGADTFDGVDLQPGDVVSISSNSLMDATAAGVDAFIRQSGSDPDARPYQIVLSPTSSLERVNDRLLEDLVLARPIWTCNRQAAVKLANRLGAPLDEVPVTVGGTFDNEMKALCDNLGTTLRAPLIIRAGARGAWVRLPGGEVTHVDGFPTKAVHKRSAGTVHTGVLCAMLAAGRSLVEATQVANAAASLSIEHSENGIPVPPARDEVLALVARGAE
ncbi:sugar kinase [Bifidobacterium pullorum subsp. saeculare]|nr:sugar kinase [Bifidobacterium pullorum subsp. saeculare]